MAPRGEVGAAPRGTSLSTRWFLLFALLFAVQVLPRFHSDAPVGDEPLELTNGYFFWNGDVISHPHHPPFFKSLAALPLRFTSAPRMEAELPILENYQQRARRFLFERNRDRFQDLVAQGRAVTLLFGLGIGWLLFLIVRGRPRAFALPVLALWAFEPNLLAYSGYVLADAPLTFFFLLGILAFDRYLAVPANGRALFVGFTCALALAVKFSAVILFPCFLLLWILGGRRPLPVRHPLLAALAWILTLGLLYLPGTIGMPDHRPPWAYFLDGFRSMATYSGHPTYLMGEVRGSSHPAYYPLALALKTPLPLLLLALFAAGGAFLGKVRIPYSWWVPGLVFFLCLAPFHNLGIRLILPCYPFLILAAAAAVQGLVGWEWRVAPRAGSLLAGGLVLWQALGTLAVFPSHLSYFNELIPSHRKIHWLGDSNLDLGQDSKRLALEAGKKGWKKVTLAFFGPASPSLYGLEVDRWGEEDLEGPRPGRVYVVNAAYLQLAPAFVPGAERLAKSWIATVPPTGRVGETFYYFGPFPPGRRQERSPTEYDSRH